MPYQCRLNNGQVLYLDNPNGQTVITMASQGAGQQQQASSSLATGPWTAVPQVAQLGGGVLIRCMATQGTFTFQVQGSQVSTVAEAVNWGGAHPMPLQSIDRMPSPTIPPLSMPPMTPMEPMAPMPPMQMGNMQMSTNPMAMRMGNMEMHMGGATTPASTTPASTTPHFCTQCGAPVGLEDRFCGSCGHALKG